MQRLTLSSLALLFCSTPSFAADFYYGPNGYIPQPPVVVEKRIIEHHHYYHHSAPVYSAPKVYYAPPAHTTDAYYDVPHYGYRHVDSGWRPRYYLPRERHWHHRHHRHHW